MTVVRHKRLKFFVPVFVSEKMTQVTLIVSETDQLASRVRHEFTVVFYEVKRFLTFLEFLPLMRCIFIGEVCVPQIDISVEERVHVDRWIALLELFDEFLDKF